MSGADTGEDIIEAPLTGRRVRIYDDPSTPSGKNWEYVDANGGGRDD